MALSNYDYDRDTERARSALYAIPANCSRAEWVEAGTGYKASGGTEDEFIQWSATGGASYCGDREARKVWNSLKTDRGGPGLLFAKALKNGWTDPSDAERARREAKTNWERQQQAHATPPKAAAKPQPEAAQGPPMGLLAAFDRYPPATADHAYIVAKRGTPAGLRVVPADDALKIGGHAVAGWLAVPARTLNGALCSIQFVPPPGIGKKMNAPGATFGESLFVVGAIADGRTVYICEGIGQAWACAKVDCRDCAVVTFGAGRTGAVAKALRKRYPAARIVIVADRAKESDAEAVARSIGGAWVPMPADKPSNYDASDYEREHGADALADLLRTAKTPPHNGTALTSCADIEATPIHWLWPNWLALGKLHILAGAPGQGKTTLAMALAATVSMGGRWPSGERCEAGAVVIWSGEDDPGDTLKPRLLAAGADPNRVHFVTGHREGDEMRSFDPSSDMLALAHECQRVGNVRLVILDPVVSAVQGDSHKNTETRRALQPVADLAAATGAAVLGISHFSKGSQGSDPAARVIGSIAFTAAPRVVLVAAKVKAEDGEDKRVLARAKSNVGPDDGGFEYHLEQSEPVPGIQASYVAWGAPVSGSARELLTDPSADDETDADESAPALAAAKAFLLQVLGRDMVPSKEVQREAREAGIAPRTLRRAREALGVTPHRGEGDKAGAWYWNLRDAPAGDSEAVEFSETGADAE